MMRKHLMTAAAALALLAGAPLHAGDGGGFKQLDADADGYVSPREAEARPDVIVRWNELDTDKNNLLDSAEFSAFEAGKTAIEDNPSLQSGGVLP